MRLIVTGYATHGKDTVCEMLRDTYGFKFESSSKFVAEKAVRPWLHKRDICYVTFEEMYADRVNHRALWKQAISEYNTPDPTRLGRELFDAGNDIYCGLREIRELEALSLIWVNDPPPLRSRSPLIDIAVWIDASQRLPREPETSITIGPNDCDYILNNNGNLDNLHGQVTALYLHLKGLV